MTETLDSLYEHLQYIVKYMEENNIVGKHTMVKIGNKEYYVNINIKKTQEMIKCDKCGHVTVKEDVYHGDTTNK